MYVEKCVLAWIIFSFCSLHFNTEYDCVILPYWTILYYYIIVNGIAHYYKAIEKLCMVPSSNDLRSPPFVSNADWLKGSEVKNT